MPAHALTVVLGSHGQLIRSGPWLSEDKLPRDMSASAAIARIYPPAAASFDRVGTGSGPYLYYRLAAGDLDQVGSWGLRLFHTDDDEWLPSERLHIQVVADD